MSSLVPEGWSQIKIGDIGSFFGGLTGKTAKDFGEGHPFLTYMQVYLQQTSDVEAMNSVRIDEGEKQNVVAYGDILFTTSSETPDEIGMTDVFLQNNQTPYLNSFCFGLRPITPSPIDPTFGKYVFRGDDFREDMRPLAQGSTRFNLSKGNLAKLSLLVPPLPEQKKIASILTSVDEVIENTQKQIDKLQDLKKATMNELLTKGIGHTEFKDSELGRIPMSWEVKSLEHVCEKIWIGLVTTMTKFYVEKGIPLIRNSDIKETGIRMSKLIQLDIDFSKKHSSRAVQKGDVVTVHTGDIGTSAVINHLLDGAQGFATLNSRINKSLIIPQFYSQILNSEDFKLRAKRVVTGDGRDNLNLKDFVGLLISVPQSLSEQENIVTTLLSLEQNIDRLTHKLSQTQSLKKSFMQDLLTGKVRVTVN